MFGKSKKSSNAKFIMAAGRAAGNLPKVKPFGNKKGPAGESGKAGPDPYRNRKMSPGQVNTFNTRGK
jgi:hypothetical protein